MAKAGYKFSLSVKVTMVTPAHVYIHVFTGMIPAEYKHEDAAGRGRSTKEEWCLRVDEFCPFLNHVQPHVIYLEDHVEQLRKYVPDFDEYFNLNPEDVDAGS